MSKFSRSQIPKFQVPSSRAWLWGVQRGEIPESKFSRSLEREQRAGRRVKFLVPDSRGPSSGARKKIDVEFLTGGR